MLNYEVDPRVLIGRVPRGTSLDTWRGKHFVSVVGFMFLDTRVLGLSVPFHRDFEEVNLRFYVKREVGSELRRGVVFIKEIVPRAAIAWLANALYNERYVSLPMSHAIDGDEHARVLHYGFEHSNARYRFGAAHRGPALVPHGESQETFITEHYWGYVSQRDGSTVEYQVEHPRWKVWRAHEHTLEGDISGLYGTDIAPFLATQPSSAFVADGSPIAVHRGVRI